MESDQVDGIKCRLHGWFQTTIGGDRIVGLLGEIPRHFGPPYRQKSGDCSITMSGDTLVHSTRLDRVTRLVGARVLNWLVGPRSKLSFFVKISS